MADRETKLNDELVFSDEQLPEIEIDFDFDNNVSLSSNRFDEDYKMKRLRQDDTKIFLEKMRIKSEHLKQKTLLIIKNALEDLRLPKKNEQLRIRTQQQINLISVILKIISEHNMTMYYVKTAFHSKKNQHDLRVKLKRVLHDMQSEIRECSYHISSLPLSHLTWR